MLLLSLNRSSVRIDVLLFCLLAIGQQFDGRRCPAADAFDKIGEVQGYSSKHALSADGSRLVTHLARGMSRVWNTRTLEPIAPWSRPSEQSENWMSTDGSALYSTGAGAVQKWDLAKNEVALTSRLCANCEACADVSRDGKFFAVVRHQGGRDDVLIYKLGSSTPALVLAHPKAVWNAEFDSTGRYLVTHSSDHRLPFRVWETDTGKEAIPAIENDDPDFDAAVGHDAKFASVGMTLLVPRPNGFDIIDYTNGIVLAKGRLGEGWFTNDVSFGPDGTKVALTCQSESGKLGPAQVFESKTGKPVASLRTGSAYCALLRDNLALCMLSKDGFEDPPEIWDVSTQKRIQALSMGYGLTCSDVHISPDGGFIAVETTPNGTNFLWRLHEPRTQRKAAHSP